MKQLKILPIKYKSRDYLDEGIMFYNVKFTDNFGPWPKNKKISNVFVNLIDGIIEGYDENLNINKSCKFEINIEKKDDFLYKISHLDKNTKMKLAQNPNTPSEILGKLGEDEDEKS